VKRPATKQTQSFVAAAEVGECLRTGGAGFVCVCVCVSVCVRCMFTLAVVSLSMKSNETLFGLFFLCLLPPARLKRTCCHIYCWSRYVYIPVALKGEAESIQLSENLYYTLGLVVSYLFRSTDWPPARHLVKGARHYKSFQRSFVDNFSILGGLEHWVRPCVSTSVPYIFN
jgi:hypothetical protein